MPASASGTLGALRRRHTESRCGASTPRNRCPAASVPTADLVVVATRKGAVLAYDLKGKLAWKSQVSSEVLMAPRARPGRGSRCAAATAGSYALGRRKTANRSGNIASRLPPLLLRSDSGVVIQRGMVLSGAGSRARLWR